MRDDASEIDPGAASASILLVDDRAANLLALEAILQPLGHRLVRAASGEEALKCLLAEDFALILLDVQMPGLDGFETAEIIKRRARTSHIPIIFITAISRDAQHVFKGYSSGAVDYLTKPFAPEILRSKVAVFVELYLKEQKIRRQAAQLRSQELTAAARRTEFRFRALTDSMPLCVWAARPDGSVYYRNRVWLEYAGLGEESGSRHEAIDRSTSLLAAGLVHPEDFEKVSAAWAKALGSGAGFDLQLRLRRARDKAFRWHLIRSAPERDEDGKLVGWIATATDIDDQKRVEEANALLLVKEQQAREAAEGANRMKDEFLATVSHELRTPLNAILGWARLLNSQELDEEKQKKALKTIERNARAQADLIEDILDVSRIVTGKLSLHVQVVNLQSVIDAALDTVRPAAESKQLELVARPAPALSGMMGDADRLQQVIWNLLANAIKFTPRGGRVELFVEEAGGSVTLGVRDSGEGIAPELQPHVFDRFRQADSSSTRSHSGLGLGLAIVRHLVELHGGTVEVASEGKGKGATFRVRLPLRIDAVEALHEGPRCSPVPERPQQRDPRRLDGIAVLVVDDDADTREVLVELLDQLGATVSAVDSAEAAMQRLRGAPPDVLLSDIGMPGEDGYALIRRVRALSDEEGGDVPAAALTAYARAEDGRKAQQAGFQEHVAKPVDAARLAEVVLRLARGRAQCRASVAAAQSGI